MTVRHALLALLSEGPKYGLQLRQEFEARTGGVWPLNVGQVYTTLQRLERDGQVVAASGTVPETVRRLALRAGERTAGQLVVGLRTGTSSLDTTDETTLAIVAPALAQTLLAGELAWQLQNSRAELITAVEDERRRLRRDLHDGLGPTLTGVAFAVDAPRAASALTRPDVRVKAPVFVALSEELFTRCRVDGLSMPRMTAFLTCCALTRPRISVRKSCGRSDQRRPPRATLPKRR